MRTFGPLSPSSRSAHRGPGIPLFLLLLLASLGVGAQDKPADESTTQAPPNEPAATTIPAGQIPSRAEETTRTLRAVRDRLPPSPAVESVREQMEAFAEELDEMEKDKALEELPRLGLRALDELRTNWSSAKRRLQTLQSALSRRSGELEEQIAILEATKEPWQLTIDDRSATGLLPDALADRVRATLKEIDGVNDLVRERLDAVLTLQNRISQRLVIVDGVTTNITQAQDSFKDNMLVSLDAVPLWRLFAKTEAEQEGEDDLQEIMGASARQSLTNARRYLEDHPDRVVAVGLCFVILASILLVVRSRRHARHLAEGDEEKEDVIDVLSRPIASAMLVSFLFAFWLFENQPLALKELLRMIAALPVLLLMRRVVPDQMRLPVYAVIVLYVLDMGGGLLARNPDVERLLSLLIASSALAVVMWVLWPGGWASSFRGGSYWRITIRLLQAAALALTVAIVANMAGAVTLATVITDATLTGAYIGLSIYAVLLIVQGLFGALLGSRVARRSRGIGRNAEQIMASFEKLTNLLAAFFWVATTLNAFRLLDSAWAGLTTLFLSQATFGNFSISLGDIFAFVVAIWLGVIVSRILRFVLQEDVFPRVNLPRGVPSAISSMIHYALITIAFFVALAVAGIDLSSFAIIAGAVGVGIGFGLQNIVNNFVSGLILLFERPIQAGDSIELGPLFGRVGRIGIRSSTVRTFQGAEVIVPNADLIAKEVINWTLSDAHRRLEVAVGVSYNAEPRQVIELLVKAAHAHREVMQEPEPFAIFVGYGSSSIDFELRAWVSNFGEGLRIQTELLLDIWDRLEEAGIEIPFPQQDLHLRTVDPDAAATLAGRPHPNAKPSAPEAPAADAEGSQSDPVPSADADAGGSDTGSS